MPSTLANAAAASPSGSTGADSLKTISGSIFGATRPVIESDAWLSGA
jgi:hypothetical protein